MLSNSAGLKPLSNTTELENIRGFDINLSKTCLFIE